MLAARHSSMSTSAACHSSVPLGSLLATATSALGSAPLMLQQPGSWSTTWQLTSPHITNMAACLPPLHQLGPACPSLAQNGLPAGHAPWPAWHLPAASPSPLLGQPASAAQRPACHPCSASLPVLFSGQPATPARPGCQSRCSVASLPPLPRQAVTSAWPACPAWRRPGCWRGAKRGRSACTAARRRICPPPASPAPWAPAASAGRVPPLGSPVSG